VGLLNWTSACQQAPFQLRVLMSVAFFPVTTELDSETPRQDIHHNLEHEADLKSFRIIKPRLSQIDPAHTITSDFFSDPF
jgi:hypothetical protein